MRFSWVVCLWFVAYKLVVVVVFSMDAEGAFFRCPLLGLDWFGFGLEHLFLVEGIWETTLNHQTSNPKHQFQAS